MWIIQLRVWSRGAELVCDHISLFSGTLTVSVRPQIYSQMQQEQYHIIQSNLVRLNETAHAFFKLRRCIANEVCV